MRARSPLSIVLTFLFLAAGLWWGYRQNTETLPAPAGVIEEAFNTRARDLPVEGEGVVVRVLSDDTDGSRHQRFVLELPSGHTVLIAHNIDIAPRLEGIKPGDNVGFKGDYEWNPEGGVIHWTHRDPDSRHPGGWLVYQGQRYH